MFLEKTSHTWQKSLIHCFGTWGGEEEEEEEEKRKKERIILSQVETCKPSMQQMRDTGSAGGGRGDRACSRCFSYTFCISPRGPNMEASSDYESNTAVESLGRVATFNHTFCAVAHPKECHSDILKYDWHFFECKS